jgi:hypothetical protein
MSIRDEENNLFNEWKISWGSDRKSFISDGIVDETAYSAASLKLLFIMKEANDADCHGRKDDWDLREFLWNGALQGAQRTYANITRWVEGIRALPEIIAWKNLSAIDDDRRRSALRSICVMNLKKSPGGTATDLISLHKAADDDKEYLKRQLSLYLDSVDIIICCGEGTGDILDKLRDSVHIPWKQTQHGVCFCRFGSSRCIIRHSHPAARGSDQALYDKLIDAVREIRS